MTSPKARLIHNVAEGAPRIRGAILDELRSIQTHGKELIAKLEGELRGLQDRFERISVNSLGLLNSFEGDDKLRARMHLLGEGENQHARLQQRADRVRVPWLRAPARAVERGEAAGGGARAGRGGVRVGGAAASEGVGG